MLGVALAIGFRPDANPAEWVAAIAVLGMITLAFAWLGWTAAITMLSYLWAKSLYNRDASRN